MKENNNTKSFKSIISYLFQNNKIHKIGYFITYEQFNREFLSISSPNLNIGNKFEITKTINRNIQLTSSITKYNRQYFITFFKDFNFDVFNSFIFQCGHEIVPSFKLIKSNEKGEGSSGSTGSSQFKFYANLFKDTCQVKYHTIISKNMEVFSQLENLFLSKTFSFCAKLIKPAVFESTNLIYILNCWKTFGLFGFGYEISGINRLISLNFGGRLTSLSGDTVLNLNLQKFNLVTFTFFQKLLKNFEFGFEYKQNLIKNKFNIFSNPATTTTLVSDEGRKDNFWVGKSCLIASRIRNKNTEIKITMDNLLNTCFSWDENLTSNFSVGVSGEVNPFDFDENYADDENFSYSSYFNYGFHMNYDN